MVGMVCAAATYFLTCLDGLNAAPGALVADHRPDPNAVENLTYTASVALAGPVPRSSGVTPGHVSGSSIR